MHMIRHSNVNYFYPFYISIILWSQLQSQVKKIPRFTIVKENVQIHLKYINLAGEMQSEQVMGVEARLIGLENYY